MVKDGAHLEIAIRSIDVCLALIAILSLSPVFLAVSVLLKLTGERQVFYRQVRVGLGGREFGLLKFVTMVKNSASIGAGEITLPNDPRVLPFGRILRKTKVNELPQLFNILAGDMSIIGPRPQTPRYYSCFTQEDRTFISRVRPGLSGVGSIIFRDEEAILSRVPNPVEFDSNFITPYKGKIEAWFVKQRSIYLYFELIMVTLGVVLLPGKNFHKRLLKRLPPMQDELNRLIA